MPKCPECGQEGVWCDEHQQYECSNGNCDFVGPLPDQKEADDG